MNIALHKYRHPSFFFPPFFPFLAASLPARDPYFENDKQEFFVQNFFRYKSYININMKKGWKILY